MWGRRSGLEAKWIGVFLKNSGASVNLISTTSTSCSTNRHSPAKLARLANPFVRRLRTTLNDTTENSATSKIAKAGCQKRRHWLAADRSMAFTIVSKYPYPKKVTQNSVTTIAAFLPSLSDAANPRNAASVNAVKTMQGRRITANDVLLEFGP